MKAKYLLIPFALELGLALVWVLGGSNGAAVAAPDAEGDIEASKTPTAELHVCPSGCAYSSIQDAVDAAADGDVIKVAAGTYTGVSARPAPPGYKGTPTSGGLVTQVVYINKTVIIQGGYTAAFTDPPDPEANPTTLDAQGQGRVLLITGNITPTVEGLRITGGNAAALGGGDYHDYYKGDSGGGVYVITAAAIISNNQVFGNTAAYGGGLWFNSAGLKGNTISGNTISGNTAANWGGGLMLPFCGHDTISGNTFSANTAYAGGGLAGSILYYTTISGNTFSANKADVGGGLYLDNASTGMVSGNTVTHNTAVWGGGISAEYAPTLNGNTISANTAERDGGGVHIWFGDGTLNGNTITNNTAGWDGGGVFLYSDNTALSGNTISGNTAQYYGGGVGLFGQAYGTARALSGNTITDNTAEQCGGLYLYDGNATLINNVVADNQADIVGSGLCILSSSSRLLHTTIARNTGGDGSGVYVTDWGGTYSTVWLTNTILVSHTAGITVAAGNTATLKGTQWGSGVWANTADWSGGGTVLTGPVNVWGDPAFVDPDSGDYHIGPGSAAVDAGVDGGVYDDIDGDDRPLDGDSDGMSEFDIGADELLPNPDLVITKQASPDTVQPGGQVTYTISVANTGNVNLHATITDTLPLSVTLGGTSIPSGGTVVLPDGRVAVTWTAVITTPGGLWLGTILVTVNEGCGGSLTNLVEVTTKEGATGRAMVIVNAYKIYLPSVLRGFS